MINYKSLVLICIIALGCSKTKNVSPQASVSFTFIDNERLAQQTVTLSSVRIFAQSGGNVTNDPSSGYVFAINGGNNSTINLQFEIPAIQSGTYCYKALSASWPRPLTLDQWEYPNGTLLQPDSINIVFQISRNSSNTIDGSFSANFVTGSFYAYITAGSFKNVPQQ